LTLTPKVIWDRNRQRARDRALQLSDQQRKILKQQFQRDRNPRKDNADAALPHDAGDRLDAAISTLLADVEERAWLLEQRRVHGSEMRECEASEQRKILRRVASAERALLSLMKECAFARTVTAADLSSTACAALRSWKQHARSRLRVLAQPSKTGRPANSWRVAWLGTLAEWWISQGWRPTTSANGSFQLVAHYILKIRFRKPIGLHFEELNAAIITAQKNIDEIPRARMLAVLAEQRSSPNINEFLDRRARFLAELAEQGSNINKFLDRILPQ
jgi:hypothetical protein